MDINGDELIYLIGKQQVQIYVLERALRQTQEAAKQPVEVPPEKQ